MGTRRETGSSSEFRAENNAEAARSILRIEGGALALGERPGLLARCSSRYKGRAITGGHITIRTHDGLQKHVSLYVYPSYIVLIATVCFPVNSIATDAVVPLFLVLLRKRQRAHLLAGLAQLATETPSVRGYELAANTTKKRVSSKIMLEASM